MGATGTTGPAAAEDGLQPRDMRVFDRIVKWPWELIEKRMDALGLDRDSEGGARKGLKARGLIAFAGTVGAKSSLFELTARGRAFAEEQRLVVAKSGKGSVVHESIVEYTQRSLGLHSSGFRFQRAGASATLGGVQPDLLLLTAGGSRVPIQACYRNQPATRWMR